MTSLTSERIEKLRCPRCGGALNGVADGLACAACGARYPLAGEVPDLLPWSGGSPGPEWQEWSGKLEKLREWRRATWDGSDRAGRRQALADDLAAEFFRFARVPESGPVLEIGCGDGGLRRYIPRRPYWGVDPLLDETADSSEGAFFLRAVGERLPLADASFRTVLLCETLDHTLDPERVLREAKRVLADDGVLAVMQSVRMEIPPPPLTARLRIAVGRLRARMRGAIPADDAGTKMHPLEQEALARLVGAEFTSEAGITRGSQMFIRALKQDPAAPRVPKRPV